MDSWFYFLNYDYPHEMLKGLVVGKFAAEWRTLANLRMRGFMNHEVPYRNIPVAIADAMLEVCYG